MEKKNESALDKSRLSFLVGYLYDKKMLKLLIGINNVLQSVTLKTHRGRPANESNTDIFYSTKKLFHLRYLFM